MTIPTVRKSVFSQDAGQNLLVNTVAMGEAKVSLIPQEFYAAQ